MKKQATVNDVKNAAISGDKQFYYFLKHKTLQKNKSPDKERNHKK